MFSGLVLLLSCLCSQEFRGCNWFRLFLVLSQSAFVAWVSGFLCSTFQKLSRLRERKQMCWPVFRLYLVFLTRLLKTLSHATSATSYWCNTLAQFISSVAIFVVVGCFSRTPPILRFPIPSVPTPVPLSCPSTILTWWWCWLKSQGGRINEDYWTWTSAPEFTTIHRILVEIFPLRPSFLCCDITACPTSLRSKNNTHCIIKMFSNHSPSCDF